MRECVIDMLLEGLYQDGVCTGGCDGDATLSSEKKVYEGRSDLHGVGLMNGWE